VRLRRSLAYWSRLTHGSWIPLESGSGRTRSAGARFSRPKSKKLGEYPVLSWRDERYAANTNGKHSSQSLCLSSTTLAIQEFKVEWKRSTTPFVEALKDVVLSLSIFRRRQTSANRRDSNSGPRSDKSRFGTPKREKT
jgi:hypothetical protein